MHIKNKIKNKKQKVTSFNKLTEVTHENKTIENEAQKIQINVIYQVNDDELVESNKKLHQFVQKIKIKNMFVISK